MLTYLMVMNLFLSLTFMILSHPLSMGLILLIQTLLISLITGNFNSNFWFSYILFLILIGGMLILFIYMTSVASNEKFNFNMKIMIITMMTIPVILILPSIIKFYININMINNEILMFNNQNMIYLSTTKFINFPSNLILMFMIIYLFLTLIVVVKITNFNYGPLRQMN
uniref:NADH-ubiquinone oxidoreductase chain 6 n=1 Tax=Boros schneideri TaxID=295960 RepID=E3VTG0_9CUCU|nr:NADH dehydrogenase subunit 6 [Boros schneideri]